MSTANQPITARVAPRRHHRGSRRNPAPTSASAAGVTRQTIIALEAGKYAPSLELAFRLSRAFGVGVEDVFQWQA